MRSGEPARAREMLKDARDSEALALRADAEAALGDLRQAEQTLQALAKLDGEQSDARIRSRAAQWKLNRGDAAGAAALLGLEIGDHSDSPQVQNLLAFALAEANLYLDHADIASRRAMRLAPGDPAVLDTRGWVLLRQGHSRAAVRILDQRIA